MTIPPGIAAAALLSGSGSGPSGPPIEYILDYTGSQEDIIVPAGYNLALIKMWGGGGGGGSYNAGLFGGPGGYSEAVFSVAAGDKLTAQVAQGGSNSGAGNRVGGWPDGGAGSYGDTTGGGGGGSSRLFINELIRLVAGGGGGSAGYIGNGGPGGAREGIAASSGASGGTQTAGGYASGTVGHRDVVGSGADWKNGGGPISWANRNLKVIGGYGGPQGTSTSDDGGGGGGGYYGGRGGGGDGRGAGGGSGYVHPSAISFSSYATVHGSSAPNNNDPHYAAGLATGGLSNTAASGGNGRIVVILYSVTAPTQISNGNSVPNTLPQNGSITHWFAADVDPWSDVLGTTLCSSGNGIAAWRNNGSDSQDAIQTVVARRPIFRTGGLNGKPYVDCDRANQHFFSDMVSMTNGAGITETSPYTIAFVVDAVDLTDESPLFGSTVNMGKTTISLFDNAGTASVKWFKTQNVRAAAVGGPIIIIVAANSASAFRRMIAGVFEQFNQLTNPNSAAIISTQFLRNNSLSDFFDGRLYEVIRWSTYLTQTEMQEVDDYFFGKYGI